MENKGVFSKDKIKIIAVIIAGIIVGVILSSIIFTPEKVSDPNSGAASVAEKIQEEASETTESKADESTEKVASTVAVTVATTKYHAEKNPEPHKNDKKEPDYTYETTKETVKITERFDSYEMREEHFELKTSSGILYATNNVIYPHFYGNSPAEQVINERYEELVSTYANRTASDADNWYNAAANKSALPYYKHTTVKVTFSSDEYISLAQTTTDYTGGARPYTNVKGYTYSSDSAQELSYKEFFEGDASFVDSVLDKAFKSETGESSAPDKWYESAEFILTDKGISFYYNVGDAAAPEEISVSYGDMEDASVKNTTVKNTAKAESNDLRQLLIDNEWYNAIQIEHTYHFYDDGSAVENTRVFNYTLEGDTLTFYWENGYVSTMKYVTKGDDYNWQEDGSFYRIYETMPEGEKFFYETDYVNTDAPDNAMWIRMK